MARYVAFVERNGSGEYFLYVPDVPGFTAGGVRTLEDLMQTAAEVFRDHIAAVEEDGDPVPPARTYDEVMNDPALKEERDHAMLVASLPLLPRPSPAERINVTIERDLLRAIDLQAKRLKVSRSELLAEGARRLVAVSA